MVKTYAPPNEVRIVGSEYNFSPRIKRDPAVRGAILDAVEEARKGGRTDGEGEKKGVKFVWEIRDKITYILDPEEPDRTVLEGEMYLLYGQGQ